MKRARQAVDYFVNKGLTKAQAAGLVGNLMRESGMNIAATNPNSGAYGLGQWLGNRKTRLFRRYGYHPTFEQQLNYIWDELNTSHRKGLQMLRASKTVNDAARNAFGYYEFSAGPEAAIRAMNGAGKNTKWKNPNGTYALNSGIKNAQMIFGRVPITMDNIGDTLAFDTPESMQSTSNTQPNVQPNIQPIISNDYAPVTLANLKELPTFGREEDNDSKEQRCKYSCNHYHFSDTTTSGSITRDRNCNCYTDTVLPVTLSIDEVFVTSKLGHASHRRNISKCMI